MLFVSSAVVQLIVPLSQPLAVIIILFDEFIGIEAVIGSTIKLSLPLILTCAVPACPPFWQVAA
jgi:hypothetical protein